MSEGAKPLSEARSDQIRQEWRRRILQLARAVQDGKVGIEALWAIDEARALYEQALQWHAYNRGRLEALEEDAARILGRGGARKGGLARAQRLTPQRRREIAKKAADARWGKPRQEPGG